MFSEIDKIIFPDSCEVIEIVPSQHYVYPIFKNGSTSLHRTQEIKKWQSYHGDDIKKISCPITVYLRDPKQRFISGVNTFVQHCQRDYPDLDTKTILYFVKNYLFLNTHYAPQFYWLINLARYSSSQLVFKNLSDLNQLVSLNDRAKIIPPDKDFLKSIKDFPWQKLELYFFLDQILIDHVGQCISFEEILVKIKSQHKNLYDVLMSTSQSITNVLPKT